MIKHHLCQYSTKELAWRQQVLAWKKQGFAFNQNISAGEVLLHFASDTGWEGIIDLQSWFTGVMPQNARMSSASWTVQQLEQLFINSSRPLEGLPAELEYNRLESKGVIERKEILDSMYSCLTLYGRIWLHGMPCLALLKNSQQRMAVGHLPVTVRFEIGHSLISAKLLKKIRQGDVLLINNVRNLIISDDLILGSFVRDEEGFMFEDDNDDDISTDFMNDDAHTAEPEKLVPRDKVTINIGFILQQHRISINDLEDLYQGKVLPCQIDAEKNMTITANGVAIARGELVWIEDRMGIEIKELYEGSDDSR